MSTPQPQPHSTDELRSSFLDFFEAHEHRLTASSSLVPQHPKAPLFTNAGMVQFLPVFFGEEPPASPRATSAQKCLRVRGKHDDIEIVGRSTRHLTFFEMLGNFSFGDYFKAGAIEYAWEFLTETLGLDGERMWTTVHTSDDEAAQLWQELVGLPGERIQRMGEDNFWEMGATGPCGPSSEIFYDKGPEHGAEGGPAGGGEERYVEIWNLVFMKSNRLEDGTLEDLAQAQHRHRGGLGANPADRAGQVLGVRDRRAATPDRLGRGARAMRLRTLRGGRRQPADRRRPCSRGHLHAGRRRGALEPGAGLRVAQHHQSRDQTRPAGGGEVRA